MASLPRRLATCLGSFCTQKLQKIIIYEGNANKFHNEILLHTN